jgi:hypothetical protein
VPVGEVAHYECYRPPECVIIKIQKERGSLSLPLSLEVNPTEPAMTKGNVIFLSVVALLLVGLNVFAAVRDNNGMRCYAQPVSEQCK